MQYLQGLNAGTSAWKSSPIRISVIYIYNIIIYFYKKYDHN